IAVGVLGARGAELELALAEADRRAQAGDRRFLAEEEQDVLTHVVLRHELRRGRDLLRAVLRETRGQQSELTEAVGPRVDATELLGDADGDLRVRKPPLVDPV